MEEKKISKQHIQVPHNLGERNEKIKIKMNPTDYLVYGYLRKFMNKDTYQTFVSLRKLAELVDVSINTVQNSIKKLKEAGEIKILEEKNGRSNIYEIQKSSKYFERFTFEFLDLDDSILKPEDKGVLLAMQQYSDTSSGTFAVNTDSNRELSKKLHIGTRALSNVFQRLEDRGILTTKSLVTRDSITGLNKTARYIDLALICQAVLFINKKVDEQGEQINIHDKHLEQHDQAIKDLQKELMKLKKENELLMKKITTEDTTFKFE